MDLPLQNGVTQRLCETIDEAAQSDQLPQDGHCETCLQKLPPRKDNQKTHMACHGLLGIDVCGGFAGVVGLFSAHDLGLDLIAAAGILHSLPCLYHKFIGPC